MQGSPKIIRIKVASIQGILSRHSQVWEHCKDAPKFANDENAFATREQNYEQEHIFLHFLMIILCWLHQENVVLVKNFIKCVI